MVIQEIAKIGRRRFVKNYSDTGFYIMGRSGSGKAVYYREAWDPVQFKDERKYEETEFPLSGDCPAE